MDSNHRSKKKKAISTFIATLLLMVLAVAAGVVIYAYTMGYLGSMTGATPTGGTIQVQSVTQNPQNPNELWIYLKNTGKGSVNVDPNDPSVSVYIDGVRQPIGVPTANPTTILEGQTSLITIPIQGVTPGVTATFKIVTPDGTFAQTTFKPSGNTVVVGALNHFNFATIGTQVLGQAFTITITAVDASGNTVTSYTGTNTLSSSLGIITPTGTAAFASGSWTGQVTLDTAGTGVTISTSGGGVSGTSGSFIVSATAPVLTSFAFNTVGSQAVNTAFSITVTAKDQFGATYTGYTGTPTLTYSAGTISPTTIGAFVAGTKTGSVTVTVAGTGVTITATDGSTTGTSNQFTVGSGTPALEHFSFSTISSPQLPNVDIAVTITAIDQFGATYTGYNGANTLSASAGETITPTSTSAFISGVWQSTVKLSTVATSVTISTSGGGKSGTSNSFDVSNSLPVFDHFTLTGYPSSVVSNVPFGGVIVTAIDQFGNTLTSYTGSVWFTTIDPAGVLPLDANPNVHYPFTSGDNGVHTFAGFKLLTQPSQTITVTDGSKSTTSSAITVNPPASKLVYTAGTLQSLGIDSLSSVITVQRQDLNGNVVSAGTTNVGLTSSSSNYKFYSDALGTQEITQITIVDGSDSADFYYRDSSAGTPTLTASSAGLSSITTTFTISAGAASKLAVSGFPNPTTAGIAGTVTVTAQDQYGNTVPSYTGTVQFTSSDSQAALPTDYTFLSTDNGVKTFSVTLKTAGIQSITATDSVTQSITGSQTNIQVNAAGASQLIFTAGKDQTVEIGTMSTIITVQRQDAYGNPTTSGGLSVTLHTTSGGGAFYLHDTDTTPLTPSIVTIANGFSSTDFYYKDTVRGTPTINTVTGLTEDTTIFNIEHHVSITITSNPVGSGFATVDGNTITTPQTFSWLEGSTHTIAATGTVSGGTGILYVWTNWSDSGAQSHTYTVPASSATVTANYNTLAPRYVTTNNAVHDTNVGTHSSFANMQNDGSYDTLTEANAGVDSWVTPTGGSGTGWSNVANAYDGSTSTYAGSGNIGSRSWSNYITLTYSSTTGTKVRYYVSRSSTDINRMQVDVYNTGTSAWENVYDGAPTTGAWTEVTFTSKTTNQVRLRFYNNNNYQSRTVNVYEVQVLSTGVTNYQLDLEVQFSGVTDYAYYTQLQIMTGTLDTENLAVYYWDGASWQLLGNLAANTLNAYTVSLTGTTYQLRFYDTTRTGDTTPSTWQIDYVRLSVP
jgi:hypothetical protein